MTEKRRAYVVFTFDDGRFTSLSELATYIACAIEDVDVTAYSSVEDIVLDKNEKGGDFKVKAREGLPL